jgi:hypothetical protein
MCNLCQNSPIQSLTFYICCLKLSPVGTSFHYPQFSRSILDDLIIHSQAITIDLNIAYFSVDSLVFCSLQLSFIQHRHRQQFSTLQASAGTPPISQKDNARHSALNQRPT